MENTNDENKEITTLNETLYDEFYIQELEKRLETDPLIAGGLLDLFEDKTKSEGCFSKSCEQGCGLRICVCDANFNWW